MNANERRQKIVEALKLSEQAISASALAKKLAVSRQIIVGDIALLRAKGLSIVATPRGYRLEVSQQRASRCFACVHEIDTMAEELYCIVDHGGTVVDVIVEHAIYGQIIGSLHLASRYDVDQFMAKVKEAKASILSQLTNGIHLHTVEADDEQCFERIAAALDEGGYLVKEEH
mgnify:CR=1 FL=1